MGGNGNNNGRKRNPRAPEPTCEELRFNTQLSSPVETILATVRPGVILEIGLVSDVTCAVFVDDDIVGTIIHSSLNRLIKCIKAGNNFYAEVRNIDGAKCAITVLHESKL